MSKQSAIANAVILYAPISSSVIFVGFAVNALANPLGFSYFVIVMYIAGLALFLAAKISLLRRGIRVSFGSSAMSPWSRRAYRAGYALMLVGFAAMWVSSSVSVASSGV